MKQKKPPSSEVAENTKYNPFDDLSFWLHIATIDFGFFENKPKNVSVSVTELTFGKEQIKKHT
jgi:hypothetical protein